jgi:2-polyprenyl-6-methoxyphenol hydroxylase-like FAD-dependent oxidoreductase
VERGAVPEKLDVEALEGSEVADDAYPIIVTLRHLAETDLAPAHNMGIANGLYRSNIAKDDTDDLIHKGERNNYTMETVKAKYVLGCDGAHSWTRRQLGFAIEGEHTENIW